MAPAASWTTPVGRGVLNGWQLSGISTLASGIPITPSSRATRQSNRRQRPISARQTSSARQRGRQRPGTGLYLRPAAHRQLGVGEKILDLGCIPVPEFGKNGALVPTYDIRTPTRVNHDLTLFKNFAITGDQKLQFRAGFFNLFNQAFANTNIGNDINLTLNTVCNARVARPGRRRRHSERLRPAAGFPLHQQTIDNFGKVNLKRGHRVDRVRAEVLLLVLETRVETSNSTGEGHGPPPCCLWPVFSRHADGRQSGLRV